MSNSCINNGTSPFCTCQDYYGYILPEYKVLDTSSQSYNCCFNANLFASPATTTGDSWLLTYADRVIDPICRDLVSESTTDSEFKEKLPILYYQTYLVASLNSKFSDTAILQDKKISCAEGQIPFIVSYPNYHDENMNYKVLCSNQNINSLKDIKFIGTEDEIEYQINYIKTVDGKNCNTDECNVKYDPFRLEYNFGDKLYKSKASISPSSSVYQLWFWLIALIFIVLTGFVVFFLYRRGMEKYFKDGVSYLNGIHMGRGDKAKIHSLNNKKSYNHVDS